MVHRRTRQSGSLHFEESHEYPADSGSEAIEGSARARIGSRWTSAWLTRARYRSRGSSTILRGGYTCSEQQAEHDRDDVAR